jgi:peptide deformylase
MLQIETGKENPILREIAKNIKTSEWKQYVKLGKEMLRYIKDSENGGIGLAAPQIGVSKRIIVVSLLWDRDDEDFQTVMMFNPEIVEHSNETTTEFIEGCLSLPKSKKGYVGRYEEIKLKYYDEQAKEKTLKLSGLTAVIVQHEIDHLDGILYTDKLVEKNTVSPL